MWLGTGILSVGVMLLFIRLVAFILTIAWEASGAIALAGLALLLIGALIRR